MTTYRDRVLGLEYHDARDLVPHAGNWRSHGKAQVAALRGVLAEVGIADTILAYRSARNGGKLTVIDGHLRRDAAPQRWPVLVLDVTDAEADYILATHDPLAAMADADAAALDALLSSVNSGEAAVQQMLDELGADAELQGQTQLGDPANTERKLGDRRKQIKPVLYVDELRDFERALLATGERNRGAALLKICRHYLEAHEKGQQYAEPESFLEAELAQGD